MIKNTFVLIPSFNGRTGLLLAYDILEGYISKNKFKVFDVDGLYDSRKDFTSFLRENKGVIFQDGFTTIFTNFKIGQAKYIIDFLKSENVEVKIILGLLESVYIQYRLEFEAWENLMIWVHHCLVNDKIKYTLSLDLRKRGVN